MRVILDSDVNEELKVYLLTQLGITNVEFNKKNYLITLDIEHNEKTTPYIIMQFIDLFLENKYSILYEFDKGTKGNFKTLKYIVEDMCCEYCYRGFVMDLFENKKVKSVRSNYDYDNAYNIEFIIEYDEKYSEDELIKYIKEKL